MQEQYSSMNCTPYITHHSGTHQPRTSINKIDQGQQAAIGRSYISTKLGTKPGAAPRCFHGEVRAGKDASYTPSLTGTQGYCLLQVFSQTRSWDFQHVSSAVQNTVSMLKLFIAVAVGSFNRIPRHKQQSSNDALMHDALASTQHRQNSLKSQTKNKGHRLTPQIQQGWSEDEELTSTSTTDNYTPSLARARHTLLTKKYTKHSTAESCLSFLSSSPQGTTVKCGLSSHLMQHWKACHCSIIRAAEECTDRGEGRQCQLAFIWVWFFF